MNDPLEIPEHIRKAAATCSHKWIGDTCTNCGIAYHIWTEHELERLRAHVLKLESAPLCAGHADAWYCQRPNGDCIWCKNESALAALKAELEQTQKQFGTCSVCGFVAWKNRDAQTEECQYCALKAHNEILKAADYEALTGVSNYAALKLELTEKLHACLAAATGSAVSVHYREGGKFDSEAATAVRELCAELKNLRAADYECDALKLKLEVASRAFDEVEQYLSDDQGFILDGKQSECTTCGKKAATSSEIVHDVGCFTKAWQDLREALSQLNEMK